MANWLNFYKLPKTGWFYRLFFGRLYKVLDSRRLSFFLIFALILLLVYEIIDLVHFNRALIGNGKVAYDFDLYYAAAKRFLSDPLTLYISDKAQNFAGYNYPPLGILLFLPFGLLNEKVAYFLFLSANIGALLLGVFFTLIIHLVKYEKDSINLAKALSFALLITTSGPVFNNSLLGQVNSFVMALCLGSIYLGTVRHHASAGFLLALACWIKIYPALLVIAALRIRMFRNTALMALMFGILLPIFLFWLIPPDLYDQYFFNLLPLMSSKTLSHLTNQSFTGSAVRLGLPVDQWKQFLIVDVNQWIRLLNIGIAISGMITFWFARISNAPNKLLLSLIVLAFIPLIAPLGWGHSFTYSIFLICYCAVYCESIFLRVMATIAWLLLLVPAYSELNLLHPIVPFLTYILYFRYFLAVIIVIVLAATWAARETSGKKHLAISS